MASDGGARPLLPHTPQNYSFAPPATAIPTRENQRNYVFVDEHNRHKRLKVMRACEGCRRRKIKCDAATTNTWPCAACKRLKLQCVPPAVSYDKDLTPGSHSFELDQPVMYSHTGSDQPEDYQTQHHLQGSLAVDVNSVYSPTVPSTYSEGVRIYQTAPYMDQGHEALHYSAVEPHSSGDLNKYGPQAVYATSPTNQLPSPSTEHGWRPDTTNNLADAMGELKIDHCAVPAYITNQKKSLAQAPPMEEFEVQLPPSSDHSLRIPPEMMPSEQQAQDYFDYFFTHIHPYVPILDRTYFEHQWHTDRESISPLLLEAIFACASFMMQQTRIGAQWLALASKHEESFRDVPRLSTLQAMVLILKARESSPKRGYFYRSWMTVVNMVAMAKDLELDDHLDIHERGESCGSSITDCISKTRIWQTLFALEVMVGGPQGRSDLRVGRDTVDFGVPQLLHGQDEADFQAGRRYTYWIRLVRHVQMDIVIMSKLKKRKPDWPLDSEFIDHNKTFRIWLSELSQDLQVVYHPEPSSVWIPSHAVANIHCYHKLAIIMHHRPQLHALQEIGDPLWKQHMLICYSAAKSMCRLQEAIIQTYGETGLFYMTRGISFTIYSVLTCTMLHLVALTSPDPELSGDARDFFIRHMRILEQCSPSWPMPEVQEQINILRTAFSADISKPFDLKASFPLGSPSIGNHPTPPNVSLDQPAQSMVMIASGQRQSTTPTMPMQEQMQWNPRLLFDHWNTTFGTPSPSSSHASPPLRPPPTTGTYEMRSPQEGAAPSMLPNVSPHHHQVPSVPSQISVPYPTTTAPYVTPGMWQDVVANSMGAGLKRQWDYGNTGAIDGSQMKRVR